MDKLELTKSDLESKSASEGQLILPNLKVQDPLFFKIKFRKKISYVLATLHVLPLRLVLHLIDKYVDQTKTCALETLYGNLDSPVNISKEEEAKKLADYGVLLEEGEEDYFSRLPKSMQGRINNLLSIHSLKTPGNKIKINFLFLLMCQETMILTKNGMDGDLTKIFQSANVRLFALDNPSVREELLPQAIRDLEPYDCFSKLYQLSYTSISFSYQEEQVIDAYCKGNIKYLTDIFAERQEPQERDLCWISKIEYLHQRSPSPCLFAFGAAHVIRILEILKSNGFKISKMDNQGKFVPFSYEIEPDVPFMHIDSVRQLESATQNLKTFRRQILEPKHPSVSWLYAIRDFYTWEEWKQQGNRANPDVKARGSVPCRYPRNPK